MTRALSFLIRYFSNYYTLHRSDLAALAAPLDPRLEIYCYHLEDFDAFSTLKLYEYLYRYFIFFFLGIRNENWILTWIRDRISLINKAFKSGSRHRDWCMLKYLNYLTGYFSSYFILYTHSQWFSCTCCTPISALGLWWFTNFYYTLFLEMVFKNTSYN